MNLIKLNRFFVKILVNIISGYQFFSSRFPDTCRFYPSCSEYTKQAIIKYGIFKGVFLGFLRISKCHPYHSGGYDPLK